LFVAGSSGAFTDGELALEEINAYRSEVRPGTCECRPECIVRSEAKHAPRGYRKPGPHDASILKARRVACLTGARRGPEPTS
jgi:hypothetical protein